MSRRTVLQYKSFDEVRLHSPCDWSFKRPPRLYNGAADAIFKKGVDKSVRLMYINITSHRLWLHYVRRRGGYMDISSLREGNSLKVVLNGELCAESVPQTEAFLNKSLGGINALTVDCGGVKRITKEGLMLLLATKKKLGNLKMALTNVSEAVYNSLEEQGITTLIDVGRSV